MPHQNTNPKETSLPGEDRPQTKPFATFLQEQRGGALHAELSDELAAVVSACMEHERSGELTLTVKVSPNKDGETLTLVDSVKAKKPEAAQRPSIFFTDSHGNLSRRNPRQPELPLREVTDPDDQRRAS